MARDEDQNSQLPPDSQLPAGAELLFEQWRVSLLPADAAACSHATILDILRSHGIRDSHETLVDTALLAPPSPPQPGEGRLPALVVAELPSAELALGDPIPDRLPVAFRAGRRRVTAALSGLTVALALALGLWMASVQVAAGSLARGLRNPPRRPAPPALAESDGAIERAGSVPQAEPASVRRGRLEPQGSKEQALPGPSR